MSQHRAPAPPSRPNEQDRFEHGAASAPPALSGERETGAPQDDDVEREERSVHERDTAPPPMPTEEYERTLAETMRPRGSLEARIETAGDEGVHTTNPPTARRGESLARMGAVGAATPAPPPASDPRGYYSIDVPRPPAVPALSIPVGPDSHASGSERFAASTDRPTALAVTAALADWSRVLRHAMPKARVAELALDHRAGFLLSRIDGNASIEEVLDMSGMPDGEALSVLGELLLRGVVACETSGRYASRRSR